MLLLYICSASRLHCHVSQMHTDTVLLHHFSLRIISLAVLLFLQVHRLLVVITQCQTLVYPGIAWAPKGSTLRRKKEGGVASIQICHECLAWMSRMYLFAREKSEYELQIFSCVSAPRLLEYNSLVGRPVFLYSFFLSHQVKDTTRWPSTLNSSLCISCWEADFLSDSEIIRTVQLHFSTWLDNIQVRLRLEEPLMDASKVVTL